MAALEWRIARAGETRVPNPITNELICEVLKAVQAQVAILREDMDSVKTRLTSQDTRLSLIHRGLADLHGDLAELSARMDRLESRLGRIEPRLNFGEQRQ